MGRLPLTKCSNPTVNQPVRFEQGAATCTCINVYHHFPGVTLHADFTRLCQQQPLRPAPFFMLSFFHAYSAKITMLQGATPDSRWSRQTTTLKSSNTWPLCVRQRHCQQQVSMYICIKDKSNYTAK